MAGVADSGVPCGLRAPDLSLHSLVANARKGGARPLAMAAHRAAASGDARASRAAREFQALFLMEMLKPLTESLGRNPLAPDGAGTGSGIYDWFWQEALATELAAGWPLPAIPGVAEAAGVSDAAPAAAGSGTTVRDAGPGSAAGSLRGTHAPVIPSRIASRMNLPPSIRQTLEPSAGVEAAPGAGAADSAAPGGAGRAGATPGPPSPGRTAPRPAAVRAPDRAGGINALAARAGRLFGVSPNLVRAVVEVESGGRTHAVSPKGAVGLMQLMPGTAAELGVRDSTDAWQNLYGGTKYLSRQLERFGSVDKALAAYNAGPTAVARHDGIPPYRETQNYVLRVMEAKARYDGEYPRDI